MKPPSELHPAADACSFCSKAKDSVISLVLGPKLSICNECVETVSRLVLEDAPSPSPQANSWELEMGDSHCDFCEKAQDRVWKLLRNCPKGCICTECLAIANDIVCETLEEETDEGVDQVGATYEHLSAELRRANRKYRWRLVPRLRRVLKLDA